jgi:hypothetical protein
MYPVTANPYKFQYLITGISGPGIECVYLPPKPPDAQIHFKKEQKFVRPEIPKHLKKAIRIRAAKMDRDHPYFDPSYVSPYEDQIQEWEDQQWDRFDKGFWFWNNGVATYITPFYYWYLTEWNPYFGTPDYRETDKEITYWLQYIEEDPNCYGGLLNTIRRYGKSALMGGWIVWRTTRNFGHFSGMQGETDKKIKKFWDLHILKPFRKLLPHVQPKFDYSSKQTEEIKFERPIIRGAKSKLDPILDMDEEELEGMDETEDLESFMDYRASGEGEYDQAVLHTYLMEEPGKTIQANVNERWKVVKPCLRRGKFIRGKALLATTVEHMNVMDKGGKAYQKIFYQSDYDRRTALNQTVSGLYAAFLPGDCAYEGFFDEWGHPIRKEARFSITIERETHKDNPKDYSDLIRKYPLTISEIFWVSADQCVFNATILQKRKQILDSSTTPRFSKFDLEWENKVRFSKVVFKHNPLGGWYKASWMFPGDAFEKYANQVRKNSNGTYSPMNEEVFTSGIDPVDHRVVIDQRMGSGEDEFVSSRRSKPVMRIKRRYDSSIDGVLTQEILEQRRDQEYQYQTGISVGYMDTRTSDPNVYYERSLMVCWLHGMSMNVESAKPGVINYFFEHGCADFVKHKYIPESNGKPQQIESGTPANATTINEYTDCLSTHIEYFGHMEPFVDFINDYLIFNPSKTKEHDYAVCSGWCELGEKIRPKVRKTVPLDITSIITPVDRNGNYIPR